MSANVCIMIEKMCRNFIIYSFMYYVLCFFPCALCEEVLGCGGFVKSDTDVNFSDVVVQLYTKQGALKDQTDCAPNNGYYFLPLYDKGEYVLKIAGKSGWTFKPKEVFVNVDGVNDPCSLGEDINFVFEGFSISGKVVSLHNTVGPKGVKISLFSSSKKSVTLENVTNEDGKYILSPVLPGVYYIQANHKIWAIKKNVLKIKVESSNLVIPDGGLVVDGYDVSGLVTSDGQPMKGVKFILFSNNKALKNEISGCEKITSSDKRFEDSVCYVYSDEDGQFVFPVLPPGNYRVRPYYQGPQNVEFDVRPWETAFKVDHNSVVLEETFQVRGFSVQGQVLSKLKGRGIVGASVYLDGEMNCFTGPNGIYHLQGIQAGQHKLTVEADNMIFKATMIHVSPNNLHLPVIYPQSFKICGRVTPPQINSRNNDIDQRVAYISKPGFPNHIIGAVEIAVNEETFCSFLEPGQYEIRIQATEWEQNSGMQFHPSVHFIEVIDEPMLSGIEFVQLKVHLHILITCIAVNVSVNCPDVIIQLHSLDLEKMSMEPFPVDTIVKNGVHVIENVFPGDYEVTLIDEYRCWNTTRQAIHVTDQDYYVHFVQTGFRVHIYSSHHTKVQYKMLSRKSDGVPVTLNIENENSYICVDMPGVYEFIPIGCHGYSQSSFSWSTSIIPPPKIEMIAETHAITGHIYSKENVTDMYVHVVGSSTKPKIRMGPLKAESRANKYVYSFQLYMKEGEKVTFEPSAGLLLFDPPRHFLVGPKDCMFGAVQFQADKGKILEGKIKPTVAEVMIKIAKEDSKEIVASTVTDKNGIYRIGPLSTTINYRISAEKDGFTFTEDNIEGNFLAHKLAEINVQILDDSDKHPLQGVLLSLSGGKSFRRNSQTDSSGKLTFTSLSPSEYFLRPMLKEYRFIPPSKLITVEEGATVNVQLLGHRVAHSVFGLVTTIAGDPEMGVVMEAVGTGNCSQYQEDGASEHNGVFRIRGLQPQCKYTVGIKRSSKANPQIQRSSPKSIDIEAANTDIRDLKFVVFHPLSQMDIFVTVESSSLEFLYSLTIKLCREDSPDSPLYVYKLDSLKLPQSENGILTFIPLPSVATDGQSYFVQLESSLSHYIYTYSDVRSNYFKAVSAVKHIKLTFEPTTKQIVVDVKQESYLVLLLGIVVTCLCWNQRSIFSSFLSRVRSTVLSRVRRHSSPSRSSYDSPRVGMFIPVSSDDVMVEPVPKRRSRTRKT